MSYSSLIQQDNPAGFWSLDETSGTDAYSHGFIVDASKSKVASYGTYSGSVDGSYFKSILPIVYGGKSSIKINSTGTITIPSLKKMSYLDCGNESAIEFWVKLSRNTSGEQILVWKGGSDKTNPEVKISLINDYIVYSIGSGNRKQSVSVHIDSINKPLHIIANYSKKEIGLIVNGVQKNKSIFMYETYFNSFYNSSPFIFLKDSGIDNIQIDSIAIYSYCLTKSQALRHFVYGCGYSIPTNFVDSNNGVYYNFSMQDHQELNKFEFGGAYPWSITSSNNCMLSNNMLSIKPKPKPKVLFKENYGSQKDIESQFYEGDEYIFDSNSYLLLDDIGSILPQTDSGWLFKFRRGELDLDLITSDQTLFLLKSKVNDKFIEVIINKDKQILCIINDPLNPYLLVPSIIETAYPYGFYIGFYILDSSSISLIYLDQYGDNRTLTIADVDLPLDSTSLRIGSTDSWFVGENKETTTNIETQSLLFRLNNIVGIHRDNKDYISTFDKVESTDFKHYYTLTPNYNEKVFKIKSYGEASVDITLQSLAEPEDNYTGACRLEIGNPYKNDNVSVSVISKKNTIQNGQIVESSTDFETPLNDRVVLSGQIVNDATTYKLFNKDNIQKINENINASDTLTFNFVLKTDDLVDQPPVVDYFRVFSYPVIEEDSNKYLTCNASPGGNPAKIYYKDNEYSVPDLKEYPFFYNGNASGLKIEKSYAKITQDYTFPSKMGHITAATKGSTTVLTIEDNKFIDTDNIVISGVYSSSNVLSTNWNRSTPIDILSVSGNKVTINLNSSTFESYPTDEELQGTISIASGIETIAFMLYVPNTTTSANIIKVGSNQMSLSGTTLSLSGSTIYVNGALGSTIKLDSWNHISFVFDTTVYIYDSVDIIIGSISGTSEFYVDQLMVFNKKFKNDANIELLENLYNLFSGGIQKTVYGNGPTLIDTNYSTTITEPIQKCYIFDSKSTEDSGKQIFDFLYNKTTDQTLTLNYSQQAEGFTDIIKTIESKREVGGKTVIGISSSSGIEVGSILKLIDKDSTNNSYLPTTYTVESLTASSFNMNLSASATSSKNSITLKFANNSGNNAIINSLVPGDIVVYNKVLHSTAQINKIKAISGSNPREIVVTSDNKTNVSSATLSSSSKIIFKKKYPEITFNGIVKYSDLTNVSFLINDSIVFENFTATKNNTENAKIQINGEYLEPGYIFIDNSNSVGGISRLFKLDTINTEIEDKPVSVVFTLDTVFSSTASGPEWYGYVFTDDEDLNISVKNEKAFKWSNSGFSTFDNFKDDRVSSFVVDIDKT